MKIAETFTKNHPKLTTIITRMLPRDKTYFFRRAKIDETSQISKAKCKSLLKKNFQDQDDDWVKSDMILNENFYYKDFLCLVETGNGAIFYICLFIFNSFFAESKHPL